MLNIGHKMDGDTTKVLLVTANVGSIFEEVSDNLVQKSRLLGWICRYYWHVLAIILRCLLRLGYFTH